MIEASALLSEFGFEGATLEQLALDIELEWASPNVVKAAVGKLWMTSS